MSSTIIQNSFVNGELSPSLYGRTDLVQWHNATTTMRNMYVDYRGGAISRAGFAYVGTCKQAGQYPPRDITFQYNINQGFVLEFGEFYMRIKYRGAYVLEADKTIVNITNANPAQITITGHSLSVDDWIYIQDCEGQTYFNGLTWIVDTVVDANNITVKDLYGNVVDLSTSIDVYVGAGTAARVYTVVSPYAAVDLPYLKFTQSQNTMSLTCVNTQTNTEYPAYDLERVAATNWVFTQIAFETNISPPTTVSGSALASTTLSTYYYYVVTAVDGETGEESIASSPVTIHNNDISLFAGSNVLRWSDVSGASSYNIYKATPVYNTDVNGGVGATYGFCGSSLGGTFVDNNIIADFTKTPPLHKDPFAGGQVLFVDITAQGTNYTQSTVGYSITTSTGSGFVGTPIVPSTTGTGAVTAFIIQNAGKNYDPADTITITDSGSGTGATATLTIGGLTGNSPSAVAYFQQRRTYANTLNAPNTYFMSQPGAYTNFDTSVPAVDDDAITGTPWAQQLDGIQFMVPMPNGLVILTGKGAWQLNGGNNVAVTPADQAATPQAYNGCSDVVPPMVINYNILYVQSKGSIIRNLAYDFYSNIYTGSDITIFSNHLFANYQIKQIAWAEEPFKLAWGVRNDGKLLSLTYLNEQKIYAWARHDTNGIFVGVTSVTEPPVDAIYVIVKRYIQGEWRYYSERMDNRDWGNVEECFCVDSGLRYPMPAPDAELTVSAAEGAVSLTASASVFSASDIGSIVRVGGGKVTVTGYTSGTLINGTVTETITATVPNDENLMPMPAASGTWTITAPTSIVSGLNHLEGKEVVILADGGVQPSQVVTNGMVELQQPASAIVVGLPFQCQLQTMYLDPPSQSGTTQSKRKTINSVGLRFEASRGMSTGTNQPDASTQPNQADIPWTDMIPIKERNALVSAGTAIPLYTGDYFVNLSSGWDEKAQVAIQQDNPLPCNLLSCVTYFNVGDS